MQNKFLAIAPYWIERMHGDLRKMFVPIANPAIDDDMMTSTLGSESHPKNIIRHHRTDMNASECAYSHFMCWSPQVAKVP